VGPRAGIIVGRADLVEKIRRNPLKRALRVDKLTIAALSAVLRIYSNPARLAQQLPTLRILTRPVSAIRGSAERALAPVSVALREVASVEVTTCDSNMGSGALPVETIPSAGLAIRPMGAKKSSGALLKNIAAAFRSLPVPVIGRLQSNLFILDFRCLEDEPSFIRQLSDLSVK
jgi:L-seryl-tRNA(Ser) seleniumtransferase